MTVTWLESRLAANPASPFFARLASHYLQEGNTHKAVELCLNGLKVFPDYATGHLVLGKCYEAMGRDIEAMLEYRKVLRAVPDNPTVKNLLRNVEQRENEAFRKFSEERARKLAERRGTLTFERYAAQEDVEKESTIDFVLRRLNTARKPVPPPPDSHSPNDDEPGSGVGAGKIVTATLAEIYAKQGEYREAIEAYRKLISQHPAEAKRFEQRIAQLEELQHAEQRS